MKPNIYIHELKQHIHSALYWAIGIVGLHLLYLPIYPAFAKQSEEMQQLIKNFPPELLKAFGMHQIDFTKVLEYYSMVFLITQILLAIQASYYGVQLVAREESKRTADFLLSMPVSRSQILTSKFLAVITALLITQIIVWISALFSIAAFHGSHTYSSATLFLILYSAIPFQLFFLSVGFALSQVAKIDKNASSYALFIGITMYIISALSNIINDTKLEWITPFKHFDPTYIVRNGHYNRTLFAVNVIICVISLLFGYRRYLHRDIPAVS